MLATITPYWGRKEALRPWLTSILGSTVPEFQHWVYFVGEQPPDWWAAAVHGTNVFTRIMPAADLSIGHYHNLGAREVITEWIMKMDIDNVCNVHFFEALRTRVLTAGPRSWFNVGMFMAQQGWALSETNLPIKSCEWEHFLSHRQSMCEGHLLPVGTNFVCRRANYLRLGGCHAGFRGWGWEDYQQVFMLAADEAQSYPLEGPVTLSNVTVHCRSLSRRKAFELYNANNNLALVHRWHARATDPIYRSHSEANRVLLLNYIEQWTPS